MLILKTEKNERKMKKRHRRIKSNVTLLLAVWKQRNTVFPLKPGPLLPRKKQFLVQPSHTVQRKELQSSSPSRHVEILSPPGASISQGLPGSVAQVSNGYFTFLDCNGGFPQFYNSFLHIIKERSLLNCHHLP